MVLNYKRIEDRMAELKLSKADVCRKANLARPTFDGLLNGKDSKISTLVEVAQVLKAPVGYFFDETITAPTIVEAVDHSIAASNSDITIGDYHSLKKENSMLEKLIDEKDERIKELKERIEELKSK